MRFLNGAVTSESSASEKTVLPVTKISRTVTRTWPSGCGPCSSGGRGTEGSTGLGGGAGGLYSFFNVAGGSLERPVGSKIGGRTCACAAVSPNSISMATPTTTRTLPALNRVVPAERLRAEHEVTIGIHQIHSPQSAASKILLESTGVRR